MTQTLKTLGISAVGGILALSLYIGFVENPTPIFISPNTQMPVVRANRSVPLAASDFSDAAEMTVNSVVHVNVAVERKNQYMNPFDQFFFGAPSQGSQIVQGSGSGVVLSADGYIVTNNHVIEGAQKIQVQLNNNQNYTATLVGTDPTTDLALLKIDAENLSPIAFGNSDEVRLGEWVLAVGNPFNLTSTVTAGIISAKGRSINIINEKSAIESFLQTDAAVNPGNSGGALVNTRGELIGINTAISTHTGSFEGYSFAIPVNIMRKVVEDLRKYGTVQRAFLGVNIADVNPELAKEQGLAVDAGVYLGELAEKGAAKDAGLQRGDVIVKVDGNTVSKSSELLEQIGRKRPGDVAKITVYRGSDQKTFDVTLKNQQGTTKLLSKDELLTNNYLNAKFENLTSTEKQNMGLRYGIKVQDSGKGNMSKAGVPKGFIVVKLNNQVVQNLDDLNEIISKLNPGDGVLIQGYHPNGKADYFAFGL